MKADLHVHSNFSDGVDSVETVIRTAKANGVTHLSFVDHDTTAGLQEAEKFGEMYGISIIPGIEISAYDFKRNRKVHVLGYYYDPEAVHIRRICEPLLQRRQEHSLWQIGRLNESGYDLDKNEIQHTALPSQTIYKQHIMAHLTTASYHSEDYQKLYRKLFKNDGPAAGDIEYIDAREAVEAITKDGGIAVLAHPGQLNSYSVISELVEAGLKGIELYHPDHTEKDYELVRAMAKEHELMMTGGTDYHGDYGMPIKIGSVTSPINSLLV